MKVFYIFQIWNVKFSWMLLKKPAAECWLFLENIQSSHLNLTRVIIFNAVWGWDIVTKLYVMTWLFYIYIFIDIFVYIYWFISYIKWKYFSFQNLCNTIHAKQCKRAFPWKKCSLLFPRYFLPRVIKLRLKEWFVLKYFYSFNIKIRFRAMGLTRKYIFPLKMYFWFSACIKFHSFHSFVYSSHETMFPRQL